MAIFGFGKKDSSAAKHHIIEVIKYDGPMDVLLWRHPNEDFNTNTQLIVQEGQEAIFLKNGQALECFPAGSYALTTQNYPFIRALVGTVTGGVSPFSCSVVYVNKGISMGIDWGTDAPIRMNDPVYNLPINITAHGDFSVQVAEPKQILTQLVGATPGFTQEEITNYFSGIMAKLIRSQLTSAMIQNKLSPLGIDAYLDSLSSAIEEKLKAEFIRYGMNLNHFAIANIGYSGLEQVETMLHEQTTEDIRASHEAERIRLTNRVGAENIVLQGQATAQSNIALGITELQKQGLEVAKVQAANVGPIMSGNAMGIGLGGGPMPGFNSTMQSAGAATTETMRVIFGASPLQPTPPEPAPDNGVMPDDGMMMGYADEEAAQQQSAPKDDFQARLQKLVMMRDAGLLDAEEFAAMKKQLLDEIMNG